MFVKKSFQLLFLILVFIALFLVGMGNSIGSPDTANLTMPEAAIPALAAPQVATLFSDNFESGTSNWDLDTNWNTVNDGGGTVLEGNGPTWAVLNSGQGWSDYTFETKVKIVSGTAHLIFRLNDQRGRYFLGIQPSGMYLRREAPWGQFETLTTDSTPFNSNVWYTISVSAESNRIRVSVNGSQRIDITDPLLLNTWPVWQGNIALEVANASQTRFDDVSVTGVLNPEQVWVRTGGPIGGLGYDVRYGSADQQVMYVTDNYSGVSKSVNGGQTWFPTNRGILGRFWPSGDSIPVFTLNVDPNNENILWAGLKDIKGAYKSTDGGQTWIDVTPSMSDPEFVFRGFTVMPGNSNVVFATGELPTGITGKEFGKVKGRVYYTADGGQTWTQIRQEDNLTRYVIIHPQDANKIYVSMGIFDREASDSNCANIPPISGNQGTGGVLQGIYSGGAWNWTYLNNGLTDMYVGSLVMHPTNPDILLAGTGNNACSRYSDGSGIHTESGIFRTTNGGQNWTQTLSGHIITAVEFAPSNPNIAYAGEQNKFYASADGGITWNLVAGQSFPWGPPGVLAGFPIDILVDPNDPNTLFVNNYGGGTVKSTDGGHTWTLASKGYTGALMFDIDVHPTSPGTVYASARSGAFHSANGGSTWDGLASAPADFAETYAIALSPHTPQIILAANELGGKLFRSLDGGVSWAQVYELGSVSGLNRRGFKRIAFAPSAPHVVYAGSCRGRGELHGGKTDALGVFKSLDTGGSWAAANDSQTADVCVNDLAVHPQNHKVVYIATAGEGVYKTSNGGQTWSQQNSGLPAGVDARSIAIHPQNTDILYLGTEGNGVYKSTDGGANWNALNAGMEPNDRIWAIEINPVDPNVVYAGSFLSGVYRWDVTDNLWTHINNGLRMRAVTDLGLSSDGTVLYAATWGEGVFRLGDVPSWEVYLPAVIR